MRFSFQPSISRALALFGLLGLGFVQVGCAHPVVIEPAVVVSSRMGHYPVYAEVGVPGPVIYAPPPPPRVIYVPQVYGPVYGVGHGHDRRHWGHDRRHPSRDEGRWGHRDGGHR
jgi:hypothetical protein